MDADAVVDFTSDDDDEVDSDIEAYLYSQLHYSTELNLDSDSELIIDKKDTDDEKLPEIIPITKEEPKAEKQNLWAIHEKDLKGADSYFKSLGRNTRYYTGAKVDRLVCNNCKERGHLAAECLKVEICHLCGLQGHQRWSCPNDICYNCSEIGHIAKLCRAPKKNYYAVCKRCWGRGHNKNNCPEIWRQYHLTVKDRDSLTKPRYDHRGILKSIKKIRYCFNCGGEGHFGHDCQHERPSKRSVSSPFIVYYDRCPFKSRRDNEPQEKNSNDVGWDRERYNGTGSRKYEDRRDRNYRNHEGKAYKKYEDDSSMCDRKDISKTESKFSKDIQLIDDKVPVGMLEDLHNDSMSKRRTDERAKDPSSPSMESRVRNLIRSRLNRDDERMRSVEKSDGKRRDDIHKAEKKSSYDLDRERSPKRRNLDIGRRENCLRERKPQSAEKKRDKVKTIVLSDDEGDEEIRKVKEKIIDFRSGSTEAMRKEKEAVKIHRTHAKKDHSVAEEPERHSRRRAWNDSLSAVEREPVKEESSFNVQTSIDMSSVDDGEKVEFVDLDIYADSDSSLEIQSANHSSFKQAFKEEPVKIEGAKKAGKKEIGKERDINEHSAEIPHRSNSSTSNEKRSRRNDIVKLDRQSCTDDKSSKVVKVEESKPDGKYRDARTGVKSIVGKVGSVKMPEDSRRRDREKEVGSHKGEFVNKEISPEIKASVKNGGIDAGANNRVGAREGKCLSVDVEKDSCLQVDRSSQRCVKDLQRRPKSIVHKISEHTEKVNATNCDDSKPNGLDLSAKRKKHHAADFVAGDDTTTLSQPEVSGRKALPDHLAKEEKRNTLWDSHGLGLSFSFDKTETKADSKSSHSQGKVFGNDESTLVSSRVINSNREVNVMNTLPDSSPPFEIGCSDQNPYDEHAQEGAENLLVEDHAVADDNVAFDGYESISDVETFQFSNMQFDPISDSSSEDDLRKTIDSLKSKRSGRLSPVALATSGNTLGHYEGHVFDGDAGCSNSGGSEMQMSPDSADRRQIDMTRYDPNNCNEDDISAYQSYADHAGGKRSSLQSTVHGPKSPINYGKRRYGVANSYKISSPFESTSAKRRKANHQEMASPPVHALSEIATWKKRVAASLEGEAASQLEHASRGERLVSFMGKRQFNKKRKENPANSTTNRNVGKQMFLNELEGKGKKARRTLKRKWRQAILEDVGPEWLKEIANFDDQTRTNGHTAEATESKRNIKVPPRIVEREGLTSSSKSRDKRTVEGRATPQAKTKTVSKKQQNRQTYNKRNVKINRGFRSSDAAKSLKYNLYR